MSVWLTEEVIRWGLRFGRRRFQWQKPSSLVTASLKDPSFPRQNFEHLCGTSKSQTCLDTRFVSAVRFYSQTHSKDLEEKEPLYSTGEESSLPTEVESGQAASLLIRSASPFFNRLRTCSSPADVLDLTCQYAPTDRQLSKCFTHMWFTMKKMSAEQRRSELQLMFEHPAFDRLLKTALKRLGHMQKEDIAHSLLGIVKLGVPLHSRVVQTFLRYIQENLGHFNEKSLSILASCLEDMEDSANVGALKKGLRLVAEAEIPNIKTVMALQTTMRLLGKDAPLNVKKKLERKALSMSDRLSLPNAQYMFSTMVAMNFSSKPLLDICSKKIKENIHSIPFSRLFSVLQCSKELLYRDIDLLTTISDHMASMIDVWSRKQVVAILDAFEGLNFCPTVFMEAFAEKVIADPESLTLRDLLRVLRVYSSLNFDLQDQRQQFLESLSGALESYLPNMSEFELLKAVHSLCILGHFPSALLEQLLQSSTLEKFHTTAPNFPSKQEKMFQTVDLCLRLDRPQLPQPLTVPKSVLGDPDSNPSPLVILLLPRGLQSVLMDQEGKLLQEMVVVRNFNHIDGVTTEPTPNQTSEAEASSRAAGECSPAESSQKTAVICSLPSGFCYGTTRPRGPLNVRIRHLKILGYKTILATESELQHASNEERIDLLRRLISPELQTSETQLKEEQPESPGSRPGSVV